MVKRFIGVRGPFTVNTGNRVKDLEPPDLETSITLAPPYDSDARVLITPTDPKLLQEDGLTHCAKNSVSPDVINMIGEKYYTAAIRIFGRAIDLGRFYDDVTAAKAYDRAAIDRRNFALYKREQSGGEMTFNKAILHPFLNFEHESGCSVCHVLTPKGREERKMREANGKEMNGGDIDGNAAHNPRNPWDRAGCVTPPTGANVDGDLVSAKTNTNSSGDEAYVSPVTFVKNEKLELICGNGASGYANAKRFRNDYLESKMTAMEEGSYSFKEEKEEGGKDKKSNKKAGKKKNGKKSKKKKGVCTSEEEVEDPYKDMAIPFNGEMLTDDCDPTELLLEKTLTFQFSSSPDEGHKNELTVAGSLLGNSTQEYYERKESSIQANINKWNQVTPTACDNAKFDLREPIEKADSDDNEDGSMPLTCSDPVSMFEPLFGEDKEEEEEAGETEDDQHQHEIEHQNHEGESFFEKIKKDIDVDAIISDGEGSDHGNDENDVLDKVFATEVEEGDVLVDEVEEDETETDAKELQKLLFQPVNEVKIEVCREDGVNINEISSSGSSGESFSDDDNMFEARSPSSVIMFHSDAGDVETGGRMKTLDVVEDEAEDEVLEGGRDKMMSPPKKQNKKKRASINNTNTPTIPNTPKTNHKTTSSSNRKRERSRSPTRSTTPVDKNVVAANIRSRSRAGRAAKRSRDAK